MLQVRIGILGRLLACQVLLVSWSCVWPPDIQERPAQGGIQVDRGLVAPSPDNVVVMTGPLTLTVEGAVVFPNPERLIYYWFVDWPQSCLDGECLFAYWVGSYPTITIQPCSGYFRSFLAPGAMHLLELFITDGAMVTEPSGRKVPQGANYAYLSWWIEDQVFCQ